MPTFVVFYVNTFNSLFFYLVSNSKKIISIFDMHYGYAKIVYKFRSKTNQLLQLWLPPLAQAFVALRSLSVDTGNTWMQLNPTLSANNWQIYISFFFFSQLFAYFGIYHRSKKLIRVIANAIFKLQTPYKWQNMPNCIRKY